MTLRTLRTLGAILALALALPLLTGCSGANKEVPGETPDQTAKRQAAIKQHKDAVDSGH